MVSEIVICADALPISVVSVSVFEHYFLLGLKIVTAFLNYNCLNQLPIFLQIVV